MSASENERIPCPVEMLHVRRGYALAWSAPWGPAASVVHRFAPEYARPPIALATRVPTHRDPPRLFLIEAGVAVVWCDGDGVWLAVLRVDGEGLAREPERIAPAGRSLAIAPSPAETHVFFEDGESVRAVVVRRDASATLLAEPLVVQRGRARLAGARAGDTPLCFAVYEHDRRLVIAHGTPERGSLVRHELPAEAVALDASGTSARAAFALTYQSGNVVEAGVLDRTGKLAMGRHSVVRDPAARYRDVRVVWIEDEFHVVARDERSDTAAVARVGTGAKLATIEGARGPFAATYQEKALSVGQVFADRDDTVLRVVRELGERTVREVREPAPPTLRLARAEEAAMRSVDELERILGGAGYRDARATRVAVANGAALRLESQRLELALRFDGTAFQLTLVALDPPAGTPLAASWLERLGETIRARLVRGAKARSERHRATGHALAEAIEGTLTRVEHTERELRFEIALDRPPPAPQLSAWLHRARALLDTAVPPSPATPDE